LHIIFCELRDEVGGLVAAFVVGKRKRQVVGSDLRPGVFSQPFHLLPHEAFEQLLNERVVAPLLVEPRGWPLNFLKPYRMLHIWLPVCPNCLSSCRQERDLPVALVAGVGVTCAGWACGCGACGGACGVGCNRKKILHEFEKHFSDFG